MTIIFCCECFHEVAAELTSGAEVYPHRADLGALPFWICRACGNWVGCHHKMKSNPTLPLGNIANSEIKKARQHIHKILDPLWKGGKKPRAVVYSEISKALGYTYHTGEIKTIEEARKVYLILLSLWEQAKNGS